LLPNLVLADFDEVGIRIWL